MRRAPDRPVLVSTHRQPRGPGFSPRTSGRAVRAMRAATDARGRSGDPHGERPPPPPEAAAGRPAPPCDVRTSKPDHRRLTHESPLMPAQGGSASRSSCLNMSSGQGSDGVPQVVSDRRDVEGKPSERATSGPQRSLLLRRPPGQAQAGRARRSPGATGSRSAPSHVGDDAAPRSRARVRHRGPPLLLFRVPAGIAALPPRSDAA
jgi:hypothetical protein